MKRCHLILLLTVSALLGCSRQSFPAQTISPASSAKQVDGRYEARLLETVAGPLPYRVAHLNPDSLPGKPALVLYLHSANGRGSDNISQLRQQKAVDSIFNYLVARRWPALPCIAPSAVRKRNGGLTTCSHCRTIFSKTAAR